MNNKKYINSSGELLEDNFIVVGDFTIINPTEELLAEAGYTEYIESVTAEDLLQEAKLNKLFEIQLYDDSTNVNGFVLGEQTMWLTVDERQQIATQISANEAIGRETMTRWFGGNSYTFPLSTWKQMLVALEVYAGDALNVTEAHKAAVNALETVEAVEAYDYTTGYPEKLVF